MYLIRRNVDAVPSFPRRCAFLSTAVMHVMSTSLALSFRLVNSMCPSIFHSHDLSIGLFPSRSSHQPIQFLNGGILQTARITQHGRARDPQEHQGSTGHSSRERRSLLSLATHSRTAYCLGLGTS
jgi:hypothetical protein